MPAEDRVELEGSEVKVNGEEPKECCGSCRYGVPTASRGYGHIVRCHRYPPQTSLEDALAGWNFPLVKWYEWCGEWKPKGDKQDDAIR